MATARVPLLDPDTGALPDSYAPPSVAIDAQTATTKAGEALASKNAAEQAEINAESARDLALGYRDTASGHAGTATTQAGIATTKAAEALGSANGAAAVLAWARTAPRMTFTQIAQRGGITNAHSSTSATFVTFISGHHVYDMTNTNSGAFYALEEPCSGATTQGVYRSIDGGRSWTKLWDLTIAQATGTWYEEIFVEPFQETFYVMKTTTGYSDVRHNYMESYNSSFALVASKDIGDARWLSSHHSADAMLSANYTQRIVMFAEYAGDTKASVNIWRTVDKGATWTATLTKTGNNGTVFSGEVRHFHCVQVDPHNRTHWWASSGDGDSQSAIYRSIDEGLTWTTLFSGSQRERACSFVFTADYVYYGTDSASQSRTAAKIVRIKRSDLTRDDVATVYEGRAVYSLTRTWNPDGFLVWSCSEGAASYATDLEMVQFYDFHTGLLYDVAGFSTLGLSKAVYHGFQSASRYQDVQNGTILARPTASLAQSRTAAHFTSTTVSRFARASITMGSPA